MIKEVKLTDIELDDNKVPLFYQTNFLSSESESASQSILRFLMDTELNYLLSVRITSLKFLVTATILDVPMLIDEKKHVSDKNWIIYFDNVSKYLKRKYKVDIILPPKHFSIFNSIPQNCKYYKIGRIIINLTCSHDEMFEKLHKDYRKQIRKCESMGIEVKFSNQLVNDFYLVYEATHKSQNLQYFGIDYFKKMASKVGTNLIIGVVYFNNQIEGAILVMKDSKMAYSFYSGTAQNPIYKGSNKYLMWQTFLLLKSLGIQKYNYGGYRENLSNNSKLNKISDFKLKFGAEIEYGYQFYKVLNPIKYYTFNSLLRIKSKLFNKKLGLLNLDGLNVNKS